jgi:hypothetical protein
MTTIRQSRRARLSILLFTIVGLGPLSACYTLLQHPRVESLNYRRPEGKSCTGCHTAQTLAAFLEPERIQAPTPPWDALTRPWWIILPDSAGGNG